MTDAIDRAISAADIIERHARAIVAERMAKEEQAIKDWLRDTFRPEATTIRVEKPRWMPERTYRWLWRTIVREVKG